MLSGNEEKNDLLKMIAKTPGALGTLTYTFLQSL